MVHSVLIVDDSNFFQARLKEIVNAHADLNVVGVAANGQEAVELAGRLKPDVISMDYEMPLLDGVSAVKTIMAKNPRPILMFSSMTYEGARITLDALDAGAADFLNKNFAEVSSNSAQFKKKFHEKLITLAKSNAGSVVQRAPVDSEVVRRPIASPVRRAATPGVDIRLKGKVRLLAIGASTGGPVALTDIITALPENFPVPVVIIQHMPATFTKAFSERLNRLAALEVKEAESGDKLQRGHVLVAPGGKQMLIDRNGASVKIIDGDDRVNYRPCVDVTFASAATAFTGKVLGLVLTGMGADGREGARLLREKGATIWSQDQASCVVYGMPAAVEKDNLSQRVLPLSAIADQLLAELL